MRDPPFRLGINRMYKTFMVVIMFWRMVASAIVYDMEDSDKLCAPNTSECLMHPNKTSFMGIEMNSSSDIKSHCK
jgi:hypothetical protein